MAAITFSTALDDSGFIKDSASLQKSMEKLGANIAKAVAAGAPGAEQTAKAFERVKASVESTATEIARVQGEMDVLARTEFERLNIDLNSEEFDKVVDMVLEANEAYQELASTANKLAAEQASLFAQIEQGVGKGTMSIREMYEYLNNPQVSANEAFAAIGDKITQMAASASDFVKNLAPVQAVTTALKPAMDAATRAASKIAEVYNEINPDIRETTNATTQLANASDTAASSAANFAAAYSRAGPAASRTSSTITAAFKRIGAAIGSAVGKLGAFFKRLVSGNKGAVGSNNNLAKSFFKLGNMIKQQIIRRALRGLINGIRDGIRDFAQYSSGFNASMSEMKSQMLLVRNAATSAFAPALQAVIPILTAVTNAIVGVLNMLGQLTAALFGNGKTYSKATKAATDYADSVGGAAKEAKKLNNQISGFDELHVLGDDGSDSGGGAGVPDVSEMWEETEIASGVLDFVDALKKAFTDGDYYEVGAILGRKLNDMVASALEWLRSPETYSKVETAVLGLTAMINGFFANTNFTDIGRLLGAALNLGVFAALTFLQNTDFSAIGRAIGNIINGFFDETDWAQVGELVAEWFNSIVETVASIGETIEWDKVGDSIVEALNSIIENFDFTRVSEAINAWALGLLNTMINVVANTKWESLGAKFAEMVNKIKWGEILSRLGWLIGTLLTSALNLLTEFVAKVDWYELGTAFWGFISDIRWTEICEDLWELIGTLFVAALMFVYGFLEKAAIDFANSLREYFADKVEEAGGNVIMGFFRGILDIISGQFIYNWIAEHIGKPFLDGVKKAFGIASPSKEMAELGDYTMQGFTQGIAGESSAPNAAFVTMTTAIKATATAFHGEMVIAGKTLITALLALLAAFIKQFTADVDAFYKLSNAKFKQFADVLTKGYATFWANLDAMASSAQAALNARLSAMVAAAQSAAAAIASAMSGAGGGFGGVSVSASSAPLSVPHLARGAVIPPNREFLAVLGDQRSGQNIEAPESLLRQIMREEGGGGAAVVALLTELIQAVRESGTDIFVGDDQIGRANERYAARRGAQTGSSTFATVY